jgi:hypothetical protein
VDEQGVLAIVAVALATTAAAFQVGVTLFLKRRQREDPLAARRKRIEELTAALRESVEITREIELDIQSGQELAERLRDEVATYEEAARLSRSEVEAVASVLRGELRVESRSTFKRDLILSGSSVVVGAGLAALVAILIH